MTDIARALTSLTLPWGPSVGTYWSPFAIESGKLCEHCGRRKDRPKAIMSLTKPARMYRSDVAEAIRKQMGPRRLMTYTTPLQVDIELRAPDRRRRDVDNWCKGILDALTHAQVWADDSLIDQLNIRRGRVIKGGQVVVLIATLDAQPEAIQDVIDLEDPERPCFRDSSSRSPHHRKFSTMQTIPTPRSVTELSLVRPKQRAVGGTAKCWLPSCGREFAPREGTGRQCSPYCSQTCIEAAKRLGMPMRYGTTP